jgi:formate hydrogenlyase subunit 4
MYGLGFLLIFITSIFFTGIIIRTKSFFSGRKGPAVLQPVWDILRLFQKGSVYSETSSVILKIAPTIYFTSVLISVMLIPFGRQPGIFSFSGDFVVFAYLLAVGKFFNILGALDTGSSFEGMGASREALYSLLVEPAFFTVMGSLALLTGHTSFVDIFTSFHLTSYISYSVATLTSFVFVIIALIENSRMPVDDPKTHLELTMIHEVMILDYSGFDLGLILSATHLRFAMYGAIIANLFLTSVTNIYLSVIMFGAVQLLFAMIIGVVESFLARFRMNHNPQFIFTLTSISLIIFLMVLIVMGKI